MIGARVCSRIAATSVAGNEDERVACAFGRAVRLKSGVRVNVVAPGPIWTPLITSTMPHEKYEEFGKDTPEGRPGQPAELAPVFVFLASQESSYVCGEVIGVTGGKPLP